ncbi:hypothetical protein Tco_0114532, partial [Tanacetum coccineum]
PVPQFMAPGHSSSGLVLHEMTSDQICSDLTPNQQETSVDNISSDLVSNKQKASDYDISGPVPPKKNVVSLADKIDSLQKEMEFLFNHFFEEYFSWNFYSIISLKNISLHFCCRPVPQFMAPDYSSSGSVLHEMTSDQICSDLTPNRQETSVDKISLDLVSNKRKASDYDISGPVPLRKNVVSLADKTDSSQKEME